MEGADSVNCPICGGRLVEVDNEHSECEVCKSQVWKSDEVIEKERQERLVVTVRNNEYFFLDHERRKIVPLGPYVAGGKKSGGNRAGKKKYGDPKREKLKKRRILE